MEENNVVVVGLGEVGRPLLELLSEHYNVIGVDISPPDVPMGKVDVLHICYPFTIKNFAGETARYIDLFKPTMTVINSTVAIGTTRAIAERTGAAVVNSPVRGKHVCMLEELRTYTKFVGAIDSASGKRAAKHFESAGLKTKILSAPEASELAKLTETTYFGLMIAWAQEVERYCDQVNQSYDEIIFSMKRSRFSHRQSTSWESSAATASCPTSRSCVSLTIPHFSGQFRHPIKQKSSVSRARNWTISALKRQWRKAEALARPRIYARAWPASLIMTWTMCTISSIYVC